MKGIAKHLIAVMLLLGFSCKKPQELDDGRPRIKSVSIAGIPQKDIVFDAARYLITVQLPAVAPEGGLKPAFELTSKTEFLEGLTPDGRFNQACGGRMLKVANDQKTAIYRNTTSYQITFLPAPGCPDPLDGPITYSRDSINVSSLRINVPLKNPFSSFRVYGITLKNVSTGKLFDNTLPPYLTLYLNLCPSEADNRVQVLYDSSASPPPDPGTYEVTIALVCEEGNKRLTFPQPLVLRK